MTGLSVDSDIGEDVDLFGLTVTDLQTDVEIENDSAEGTLKYVDDYSTAFPSGEDSGNYIVVHAEVPVEGATVTAEVVNGTHGPVVLDEDGIGVFRITDKDLQKIKFVASMTGLESVTKIVDLSGLILETE